MGKRKFLIGGAIVLAAIIYLTYTGFSASATYYYTVSEIEQQREDITGENVRVSGQVVPGSVREEAADLVLYFDITDDQGSSLPVEYHGAAPDTFRGEGEVVVEGTLDRDGTFDADTILTKCPSKYVPEEMPPVE